MLSDTVTLPYIFLRVTFGNRALWNMYKSIIWSLFVLNEFKICLVYKKLKNPWQILVKDLAMRAHPLILLSGRWFVRGRRRRRSWRRPASCQTVTRNRGPGALGRRWPTRTAPPETLEWLAWRRWTPDPCLLQPATNMEKGNNFLSD